MEIDKSLFENCRWCNGGGKEPDGHYPCPDCEGTGMKGGKYAVEVFDLYVEETMKTERGYNINLENKFMKNTTDPKLFEVYVNNGLEYDDGNSFTSIIVANSEKEAEERIRKTSEFEWYETHNTWIIIKELDIVDGYKIILEKYE